MHKFPKCSLTLACLASLLLLQRAAARNIGTVSGQSETVIVSNQSITDGYNRLGYVAGSEGTLIIDGSLGPAIDTCFVTYVGFNGVGNLLVKSGGQYIDSSSIFVGGNIGSEGTISVDGVGSLLRATNSGVFSISFGGSGSLSVTNGGAVKAGTLLIGGSQRNIPGFVNVEGATSTLNANHITVGSYSPGNLTIQSGGTASGSIINIGSDVPGQVIVDGPASALIGTAAAVGGVSVGSNGSLTVRNGASAAGKFTIRGAMVVEGSNSTLTAAGFISIPSGSLLVKNSAVVSQSGQTIIGTSSTGGQLVVDGQGSRFESTATNGAGTRVGDADSAGSLIVSNGGSYTERLRVTNGANGLINIDLGTITAAVTNSGTFVDNGLVQGRFLNAFDGRLSGNGTIDGPLTLEAGSNISPGMSTGAMDVGATTWNGGAVYEFEINNALGSAGTESGWDLLDIGGTLSLNGTALNPMRLKVVSVLASGQSGEVADFDSSQSYQWTFASASEITGFTKNGFVIDASGFANPTGPGHFEVRQIDKTLELAFVVPEPSAVMLASCGALIVAACVQRRRNSVKQTVKQ